MRRRYRQGTHRREHIYAQHGPEPTKADPFVAYFPDPEMAKRVVRLLNADESMEVYQGPGGNPLAWPDPTVFTERERAYAERFEGMGLPETNWPPIPVDGAYMERERYTTGTRQLLLVHARGSCAGEHCVIHNPSDHSMRDLPTHWRADRGLMERICDHGVGHPDPDSLAYLGSADDGTHGCCEFHCCRPKLARRKP